MLFESQLPLSDAASAAASATATAAAAAAAGPPDVGIHNVIRSCIGTCDSDNRKELYTNILLTGGSSIMSGLPDRLHRELGYVLPQKFKLVSVAAKDERRYGAWVGGSILASLGSFHQMWISKQEYEEHGSAIVHRKCP